MKHFFLSLCGYCLSAVCVAQHASARFGALQWTFHTTGKIFSSPVLYGDLVLVGSEDDTLYALDAATGKPRWTFKTGGAIDGTPALAGGTAFFNSYDGNLYAVDASSGRLNWKFRTRGEKRVGAPGLWTMKPATRYMDDPFDFFESSAVADSSTGLLYFGSGDGNLYALGVSDGRLRWRFQTGGIIHTSPALSGRTVYFGSWDRNLYALDARTGRQKWKFVTGADTSYHLLEGIQASPLVYGTDVFFGARDGYFYCLDTATGRVAWKYDAAHSWILSTAAAADHTIYTGTSDTYLLLALDARTGKEKFRTPASGYVYTPPVVYDQTVYFGDFTGRLLAADLQTGSIVDSFDTPLRKRHASSLLHHGKLDFAYMTKGMDPAEYSTTLAGMKRLYTLGPILCKPAIANGVIYFCSAEGTVYAIRLTGASNGR